MRVTGHIAGAYLVTKSLLSSWSLGDQTINSTLLVLGTLSGGLPDLDYLYYAIKSRGIKFGTDFQHHKWISHTFPFYIIPGLFFYFLGETLNASFMSMAAVVITVAATTHLLLDMIGSGDGIMWAWPFSKRMDGVFLLNVHGKEWIEAYARHPISWVENTIVICSIVWLGFDLLQYFLK